MNDFATKKLITIVTEAALEDRICEALPGLGATGYTVVNARGRGSRGVRDAGWSSSGNIRIEVVCKADTAEKIVSVLRERYYRDYAMVIFVSDVEVLRADKF